MFSTHNYCSAKVMCLKCCKSVDCRHGRSPSFPMAFCSSANIIDNIITPILILVQICEGSAGNLQFHVSKIEVIYVVYFDSDVVWELHWCPCNLQPCLLQVAVIQVSIAKVDKPRVRDRKLEPSCGLAKHMKQY